MNTSRNDDRLGLALALTCPRQHLFSTLSYYCTVSFSPSLPPALLCSFLSKTLPNMAASFRQMAGIPDSTASTSDSVLVIIDAQNEYQEGALKCSNIDTVRPAIADLASRYRAAKGHVAHIVHSVPDGTPVFTPKTSLAEEFPELATERGQHANETLISKKFPGSFAETDLQDFVEKSGKKKVVLVGAMAHVCVSTTAREAHQKGYEVVIAEDAVADRDIPGISGVEVTKVCSTGHALSDRLTDVV